MTYIHVYLYDTGLIISEDYKCGQMGNVAYVYLFI